MNTLPTERQGQFKSFLQVSQDRALSQPLWIAARYIVTVKSKKELWESPGDSHTVAIQWVHVVMDPPVTILLVHSGS